MSEKGVQEYNKII